VCVCPRPGDGHRTVIPREDMLTQNRAKTSLKCPEVKLVLLGDAGVGKSSLAQRYVTNNFKPYCETTIGASFMSKMVTVDGVSVKCQIWDTAGQEKYHSLAPMYYRGANAAILVYDITSAKSFDRLKEWAEELMTKGPENILLAVAGNKSDLDGKRQVPTAEARAYADRIKASFIETSAKDDVNVVELFTRLTSAVPVADLPGGPPQAGPGFRIDARQKKAKRCC